MTKQEKANAMELARQASPVEIQKFIQRTKFACSVCGATPCAVHKR